MIDCKTCLHGIMCSIRKQAEEKTFVKFPDGKVAIYDMESALVSCDHFVSAVAMVPAEVGPLVVPAAPIVAAAQPSPVVLAPSMQLAAPEFEAFPGSKGPVVVQADQPEESWTFDGRGGVVHRVGEGASAPLPERAPPPSKSVTKRISLSGFNR